MSKLTVGVLRGGPSRLYDASLATGNMILKHMPEKYRARDIFISKNGEWHVDGLSKDPADILRHVDVVWNGLHGEYGEDGKVQRTLESFGIPYTGSNAVASSLSMAKHLSKQAFENATIKTPESYLIEQDEDTHHIIKHLFENFHLPAVVKPVGAGSMLGVTIVRDYGGIAEALKKAFAYSDKALIEEFIRGREATVSVLDNFRGHDVYVLFPVEVVSHTEHRCPGAFSDEQKQEIERIAREVYSALGLRHYARIDMIVTPKRGVYVLEANTLPRLHKESTFLSSLEAGGIEFPAFLDHIIGLALA